MEPMSNNTTDLLYQTDSYLFECISKIIDIQDQAIILDRTIFYPQGGGQPSDKGIISSLDNDPEHSIKIEMVRMNSQGQVLHFIHENIMESSNSNLDSNSNFIPSIPFKIDQKVKLSLDKDLRMKHCRLHTGGHLVDHALDRLGFQYIVGKGYHFPDSPYVEYSQINPPPFNIEEFKKNLDESIKEIIKSNVDILVHLKKPQELKMEGGSHNESILKELPLKIIESGSIIRLVEYAGFGQRPCGGTHLKTTGEAISVTIRKISKKAGSFRISYLV